MKKKILLLCGIFLSSNVAIANSITLPEPKGVYGVGTANVELSDPTRTQLRSGDKRRWMATVFYPTTKTDSTAPYMVGTIDDGIVRGTKVLGHAIPDAKIIAGHKFPVIISFPGRGGERQKESILYESLASRGYIVITMDQPYVANFVRFPDGSRITLTLKDLWYLPRDRDYRYLYDDEIIASAIGDIDFVLENLNAFGALSKSFDTSKIIIMGHSIGGNIAHIKGFADSRIKVVVDIDSKITERAVFGRIGVHPNPDAKPVLFIRGMMQYQEDVGDQLTKIPNSTIWSPNVQHSAFSDDAYFAAKIPNYDMGFWPSLYNWIFKISPHFSDIDTNLGEYNVNEWFDKYPEYIADWLDGKINYHVKIHPSLSEQAKDSLQFFEGYIRNTGAKLFDNMPNPEDHDGWKAKFKTQEELLKQENIDVVNHFKPIIEHRKINGVDIIEVTPKTWNKTNQLLIYLHGGGFTLNSAKSQLIGAVPLSDLSGIKTIVVDYKQAPFAKHPEILRQITAVIEGLLNDGYPMKSIGIYGDSAGGNLAVAATMKLRDEGYGVPAAIALWSPWLDLTRSGESYILNEPNDPVLSSQALSNCALAYASIEDLKSPYVSPLFGDFSKEMPPVLIQFGTDEMLADDSKKFAHILSKANKSVILSPQIGMWHAAQAFDWEIPETVLAIKETAQFFKELFNQLK